MSSLPCFFIPLGPNFVQWIRTFYGNLSTCVLNNGFTTDIFFVKCGVRQGDPLSPLLFILALETSYVKFRDDKNMKGFLVNWEIIKATLFADDMTSFLRDTSKFILSTFDIFAKFCQILRPLCK